ncbi:MAG: diaminopropionate ammonia-lyase [Pseudomonadota bacterium]
MTLYFDNPFQHDSLEYGVQQRSALDPDDASSARQSLRSWDVYEPTPLLDAGGLAGRLGVDSIWIKDEASRKPLKSFKSLGGAYALMVALSERIAEKTGEKPSISDLANHKFSSLIKGNRIVATTDGNHGRSLAWGAQLFGVPCTIFVPKNVSEGRKEPIRALGADVVTFDGNYDQTMEHCAKEAAKHNWVHIQDTSHEGFTRWHRVIMEGYTLMVEEAFSQFPDDQKPTHMFLQVGCGGMAAAIVAHMVVTWGVAKLPKTILVQSEAVDPLVQSFAKGTDQIDMGDHNTALVGIACGEVASLAKDLLYPYADGAMTVKDDDALSLMREAAQGELTGAPFIMGETGASGLAAAVTACQDQKLRERLSIDATSRIFVVSSEGDTDPEFYKSVIEA